MNTIETKAYAKLNLTLDITGRRADGYHDLDMVMISCGLHDVIRIHLDTGKPWQLRSNRPELSDGPNDLTWRAAETYFARTGISCTGLTLSLEKRIPAGAGLGGGSSDAAAVLHALNRFYGCPLSLQALCEIGLQLGADVPYCLVRGTQRALGKGERLTPLPPCRIVGYCSVNRRFLFQHRSYSGLSTPEMIFRTPIVGQWQRPSAHRI